MSERTAAAGAQNAADATGRDEDKYGRKLRVVKRNGTSKRRPLKAGAPVERPTRPVVQMRTDTIIYTVSH
jgi:hypothetical protein